MSNLAQGRILSQDELIALAEQMRAENPDIWPSDLLNKLSAAFLSAYFPQHADDIKAGKHDKTCSLFSLDMLNAHKKPSSQFLSKEMQEKHYGGIEALLFDKLEDGIMEFYANKLNGKGVEPIDPLTCDAHEF